MVYAPLMWCGVFSGKGQGGAGPGRVERGYYLSREGLRVRQTASNWRLFMRRRNTRAKPVQTLVTQERECVGSRC